MGTAAQPSSGMSDTTIAVTADTARTEPTDRSMPPVRMTTVKPVASFMEEGDEFALTNESNGQTLVERQPLSSPLALTSEFESIQSRLAVGVLLRETGRADESAAWFARDIAAGTASADGRLNPSFPMDFMQLGETLGFLRGFP